MGDIDIYAVLVEKIQSDEAVGVNQLCYDHPVTCTMTCNLYLKIYLTICCDFVSSERFQTGFGGFHQAGEVQEIYEGLGNYRNRTSCVHKEGSIVLLDFTPDYNLVHLVGAGTGSIYLLRCFGLCSATPSQFKFALQSLAKWFGPPQW